MKSEEYKAKYEQLSKMARSGRVKALLFGLGTMLCLATGMLGWGIVGFVGFSITAIFTLTFEAKANSAWSEYEFALKKEEQDGSGV